MIDARRSLFPAERKDPVSANEDSFYVSGPVPEGISSFLGEINVRAHGHPRLIAPSFNPPINEPVYRAINDTAFIDPAPNTIFLSVPGKQIHFALICGPARVSP